MLRRIDSPPPEAATRSSRSWLSASPAASCDTSSRRQTTPRASSGRAPGCSRRPSGPSRSGSARGARSERHAERPGDRSRCRAISFSRLLPFTRVAVAVMCAWPPQGDDWPVCNADLDQPCGSHRRRFGPARDGTMEIDARTSSRRCASSRRFTSTAEQDHWHRAEEAGDGAALITAAIVQQARRGPSTDVRSSVRDRSANAAPPNPERSMRTGCGVHRRTAAPGSPDPPPAISRTHRRCWKLRWRPALRDGETRCARRPPGLELARRQRPQRAARSRQASSRRVQCRTPWVGAEQVDAPWPIMTMAAVTRPGQALAPEQAPGPPAASAAGSRRARRRCAHHCASRTIHARATRCGIAVGITSTWSVRGIRRRRKKSPPPAASGLDLGDAVLDHRAIQRAVEHGQRTDGADRRRGP